MTLADELAREIEKTALDVENIRALSRTEPHVFAEEKDAASRRLKKLASRVRNEFGGAPGDGSRFQAGSIPAPHKIGSKRREISVERRRRIVAV